MKFSKEADNIIKEFVMKELDAQLFTHGIGCETDGEDCEIHDFLLEYRKTYKETDLIIT